ncbi:MAG: GTPase domain-containing protein [Butyrivibrio sp.]|nr:GTPase domain-containing protein [Butyrivibrio sp.]
MEKGNVLVVGYSGVGKSTLIKTVLGEEAMKKKASDSCSPNSDFQVYENSNISFRLIDTTGIEPGMFKEQRAVKAVRKWSAQSIKSKSDNQISVVWFCVDSFTCHLFPKTIDEFMDAISVWKNVPIIVVITQSYAKDETQHAEEIVRKAFLSQKSFAPRLTEVISVVAKPRTSEDGNLLPPKGIPELIKITNNLLPEGLQAAKKDVARYILSRKRAMSHAVVSVATLAGITAGFVGAPIVDLMLLKPTESIEIESIFRIWEIKKSKEAKELQDCILDIGTVSLTGKTVLSSLKLIPGVNLGAATINAFISGTIVFVLGEAASYIFEQIYTGKKTINDVEWVKKVIDDSLTSTAMDKITSSVKSISKNADKKEILAAVTGSLGQK